MKRFKKMLVFGFVLAVLVVAMGISAFASAGGAGITGDMLEPVLEGVTANIGVILPIGVGLFAIVLGIKFIPRIFHMFTRS